MFLFISILVLLCATLVAATMIYNSFVTLRNKCDEAYYSMDVYLKKRWDLIPNLVETVKSYAKHERESLEAVVQARNLAIHSGNVTELQKHEHSLNGGLKHLFVLSEAYPDLKANQNFITLQNQLHDVEEDIMQARKYYNAVVKAYNTQRELFPPSLVARLMHLQKKDYFEIEGSERANVNLSL